MMSPCLGDDHSQCANWTDLHIKVTCWSSYGSSDISETITVRQKNSKLR